MPLNVHDRVGRRPTLHSQFFESLQMSANSWQVQARHRGSESVERVFLLCFGLHITLLTCPILFFLLFKFLTYNSLDLAGA